MTMKSFSPTPPSPATTRNLVLDEGGDFKLIDRDSTNGTKVNGERISEQLLKAGDNISLGNVPGDYISEIAAAGSDAEEEATGDSGESGSASDAGDTGDTDLPDEDREPEISESSHRPASFAQGGFGAKPKQKDPGATLLFSLATFGILACILAAVFALGMSAG